MQSQMLKMDISAVTKKKVGRQRFILKSHFINLALSGTGEQVMH